MKIFYNGAFTLTEVLLAVVIVGIIAAIVLPAVKTAVDNKVSDFAYEREVNAIQTAVDSISVTENKKSFFDTMLYLDSAESSYANSSGAFIKKYLRIAKYCGDNNGECFADKYYEYNKAVKKEYIPKYAGSCASLKNGVSICMLPQIGAVGINGIIDLNGKKGPNIFGRDLRLFSLPMKTRIGFSKETEDVIFLDEDPIKPEETIPQDDEQKPSDPCLVDASSIECCNTKTINSPDDVCCTYDTIFHNNPKCRSYICQTHYRLSCYTQPQNYKSVCLYDTGKDTAVSVDYICAFFKDGTKLVDHGTFNSRYPKDCWEGECTAGRWGPDVPGNVSCKFTNPTVIYKGKSYTNLPKSGCDGGTTCYFTGLMKVDCGD